jgi:aerobic carbon-monoxide dehydrogenase medium subunit
MLPRAFEYARPDSVEDAVALLGEYGERAKVLAGGQSLIPLMKLRLAAPEVVIDINRIRELGGIREESGGVVIGSLTRHREVEHSARLREHYALLGDAAPILADPQVRNRGTVGGSLAHADPAADWATTFLALGAEVDVRGPKGARKVPIDAFFQDSFVTNLAPNELITAVRLPKPAAHAGTAYLKLKRKTGDFATVSVAVHLALDGEVCRHVRIALGGVGPTPLRAARAEKALEGHKPEPNIVTAVGAAAADDARPTGDLRGSVEYKRAMVAVYTQRAVERAIERARGRK